MDLKYDCPECVRRREVNCMARVVDRLVREDGYAVFLHPVSDSVAPNYSRIIKTPMDFTLIRKRLRGLEYDSLENLRQHINLVWRNALDYNPAENMVAKLALRLQRLSIGLFQRLEDRLKVLTVGQRWKGGEEGELLALSAKNPRGRDGGEGGGAAGAAGDGVIDNDEIFDDSEGERSEDPRRKGCSYVQVAFESDRMEMLTLLESCAACGSNQDRGKMAYCLDCGEAIHVFCLSKPARKRWERADVEDPDRDEMDQLQELEEKKTNLNQDPTVHSPDHPPPPVPKAAQFRNPESEVRKDGDMDLEEVPEHTTEDSLPTNDEMVLDSDSKISSALVVRETRRRSSEARNPGSRKNRLGFREKRLGYRKPTPAAVRELRLRLNWRCDNCVTCTRCGGEADTKDRVICIDCGAICHPRCARPPIDRPVTPFRCSECVKCRHCGTRCSAGRALEDKLEASGKMENVGSNASWMYDFTMCHPCGTLYKQRKFCPICDCLWEDANGEGGEEQNNAKYVQCDRCKMWVHTRCDDILSDDALDLVDEDVNYFCPDCRCSTSTIDVRSNPNTPAAGGERREQEEGGPGQESSAMALVFKPGKNLSGSIAPTLVKNYLYYRQKLLQVVRMRFNVHDSQSSSAKRFFRRLAQEVHSIQTARRRRRRKILLAKARSNILRAAGLPPDPKYLALPSPTTRAKTQKSRALERNPDSYRNPGSDYRNPGLLGTQNPAVVATRVAAPTPAQSEVSRSVTGGVRVGGWRPERGEQKMSNLAKHKEIIHKAIRDLDKYQSTAIQYIKDEMVAQYKAGVHNGDKVKLVEDARNKITKVEKHVEEQKRILQMRLQVEVEIERQAVMAEEKRKAAKEEKQRQEEQKRKEEEAKRIGELKRAEEERKKIEEKKQREIQDTINKQKEANIQAQKQKHLDSASENKMEVETPRDSGVSGDNSKQPDLREHKQSQGRAGGGEDKKEGKEGSLEESKELTEAQKLSKERKERRAKREAEEKRREVERLQRRRAIRSPEYQKPEDPRNPQDPQSAAEPSRNPGEASRNPGEASRNPGEASRNANPYTFCLICRGAGDSKEGTVEGRLLPVRSTMNKLLGWVHSNCAFWSSEVHDNKGQGCLHNVESAINAALHLRCAACSKFGAGLRCCFPSCNLAFHFRCLRHGGPGDAANSAPQSGKGVFLKNGQTFCARHVDEATTSLILPEGPALTLERRLTVARIDPNSIASALAALKPALNTPKQPTSGSAPNPKPSPTPRPQPSAIAVKQEFGINPSSDPASSSNHAVVAAKTEAKHANASPTSQQAYPLEDLHLSAIADLEMSRDLRTQGLVGSDEKEEDQVPPPCLTRVGALIVQTLGKIEHVHPSFHTERYIFPVGFKSLRIWWDYRNPGRRTMYTCAIVEATREGKKEPKFCISHGGEEGDREGLRIEDESAGRAWSRLAERVRGFEQRNGRRNNKGLPGEGADGRERKTPPSSPEFGHDLSPFGLSGPHFFGFAHPEVVRKIEHLPHAHRCLRYVFLFRTDVSIVTLRAKEDRDFDPRSVVDKANPFLTCPPEKRSKLRSLSSVQPINPSGCARGEPYEEGMFSVGKLKDLFEARFGRRGRKRERSVFELRYPEDLKLSLEVRYRQLKRRRAKCVVMPSQIHAWGLFATEHIGKDEMVIEYLGELIRQTVADLREKRYEDEGLGSCYMFRVDENYIVDSTRRGNVSRFINHSCDPNCYTRVVNHNGNNKIVILAKRDIYKDEEITYDYKFQSEKGEGIPCSCGAPNCAGRLN
ncbi:hypothetical protein AAMO2058_001291500 [Amorphochlora amoebiformis]